MNEDNELEFFGSYFPDEILETLIYYDMPRSFTINSSKGDLLLAHWLDTIKDDDIYVVVLVNEQIINDLKNYKITVYDSLNREPLWVVKQNYDGALAKASRHTLEEVDRLYPNSLPKKGIYLYG